MSLLDTVPSGSGTESLDSTADRPMHDSTRAEEEWGHEPHVVDIPTNEGEPELSSSDVEDQPAGDEDFTVTLPINVNAPSGQQPNIHRLPDGAFIDAVRNGCNVVWNGRPMHCWCRPTLRSEDGHQWLNGCNPIFGQCRFVLGRFVLIV